MPRFYIIAGVATETLESSAHVEAARAHCPGLVQVWSPEGPVCRPIPLEGELLLGREGPFPLHDVRVSRQHCRVSRDGEHWQIEDLGSRNGTFVAGNPLRGRGRFSNPLPLRLGHCIFLAVPDVESYRSGVTIEQDLVIGPELRAIRQAIAQLAESSENLLIVGPSGAGKENAARYFHASNRPGNRPFVAVNCAAIPEGLAERLLFGTTKGAYSGATESAQGYIQAAHGGTLFLDEVGELDLTVQGKLLRVLEAHELVVLGSTRPQRVDIRVCFATHRDLRRLVVQQRFRQDLFFRIATPEVRLPALAQRLAELPYLIQHTVAQMNPPGAVHCTLVETCLLRSWPGNIRELIAEVRAAARASARAGRPQVARADLSLTAGVAELLASPPEAAVEPPVVSSTRLSDRSEVEAALRAELGNVRGAARRLGVHRNQLRRWLDKHGIDTSTFHAGADEIES